ncbi:MAG: 4Fe-4S dicluster domain-containing protein [Oscillospiraceae bacterium]
MVDKVRKAGVVGAGGAGFPTHVKLNAKSEYYIINAAECEPLLEVDKFLAREFADKIISAVDKVGDHVEASKKVIAIKETYKKEIKLLQDAIDKQNSKITIYQMPAFYPAGDEQVMVKLVTGRSVPERGIPLDVGCIVNNTGTVLNIEDALNDIPVCDKFISITGDVKDVVMLNVPIGISVEECLKYADITIEDYGIILGGPMMGSVHLDGFDKLYIKKVSGNILVLPKDHYLFVRDSMTDSTMIAQTKSACIQCNFCTDLCPRYLIGHNMRPSLIMRNIYREDYIKTDEEYLEAFGDAVNCCECGICELFSCPMNLSPRKMIMYIKGRLREKGLTVEKPLKPHDREGLETKKIPTKRLIARLGLDEYYGKNILPCVDVDTQIVRIDLSQHIGAKAIGIKKVGDIVKKGDLIAKEAEGKLSINIHSSIDGLVKESNEDYILIAK